MPVRHHEVTPSKDSPMGCVVSRWRCWSIALVTGNTGWIAVAGRYDFLGPIHGWNAYRHAKALDAIGRSA
jgi:hypothetical protein